MEEVTFTLFISGDSPFSRRAIDNVHRLGKEELQNKYKLEVIDLDEKPEMAFLHQIMATPMLVKESPPPKRRVIGDLSCASEVVYGLRLN